ncbi:MAG TPA: transcription antitermination factor NusB [Lachnospiraceae bacterium]|nr:transcription antitermination factor NusB [Lachnospiraceae bacterium]
MGRSELREHIFRMLFRVEFHEAKELPEQLKLYFEQLEEAEPADQAYIQAKYEKIAAEKEQLDEKINACATGWKTSRMNKVDLTILRLAVYEIMEDEDIPTGVAINEAVELAKKYSSEDGPSFINGVLGRMVKEA